MRKRIFEIIEVANPHDKASAIYDLFMLTVIICSLIPLAFKYTNPTFELMNSTAACIFITDYILRLTTADYKLKKGAVSFLLYPFTGMAIIDFLSILPAFSALFSSLRLVRLFRLFRTFRVFRAFKAVRYIKSLCIIAEVIRMQYRPLLGVCFLAVGYVLVSALVVFNVEPETFDSFFEAVYWATVSLTTVGYGDIYPLTTVGRIVTMISSFVGMAIIALPSGIVTAGYMEEIRLEHSIEKKERKRQRKEQKRLFENHDD